MKYSLATIISFFSIVFFSADVNSFRLPGKIVADISSQSANNDTLLFTHIITRHGDRTPPGGSMQLTNEGKMQMFKAGEYFRRRYGVILGDKYSPETIYIISTDTDRASASALATLAGLFVPTGDEIWNKNLLWQPIPVHTLPEELDTFLYGGKPCPKYNVLYKYYMEKSPEALEVFEKYGEVIAYWSKMSGKNLTTIERITDMYKRYMADKEQHREIPEWAEEAIKPNGTMEYISMVTFKLRGTPELVRIRSGFLIKQILERSAQKLNGTLNPDRSMWIYSAHSSTLITMLNGFGLDELHLPPYASSLHFELYKTPENKHYMQFVYRKPDVEYPDPMNIPGCGLKWTLEQFYSANAKLIPGDFEDECKV